jgi:hypothetical protein
MFLLSFFRCDFRSSVDFIFSNHAAEDDVFFNVTFPTKFFKKRKKKEGNPYWMKSAYCERAMIVTIDYWSIYAFSKVVRVMLLCCIAENHGILFLTFLIARVVRVG